MATTSVYVHGPSMDCPRPVSPHSRRARVISRVTLNQAISIPSDRSRLDSETTDAPFFCRALCQHILQSTAFWSVQSVDISLSCLYIVLTSNAVIGNWESRQTRELCYRGAVAIAITQGSTFLLLLWCMSGVAIRRWL
jgi:hypothetical protein